MTPKKPQEDWKYVGLDLPRAADPAPWQRGVAELLRALGLPASAQPESCHWIVHNLIVPEINRLRAVCQQESEDGKRLDFLEANHHITESHAELMPFVQRDERFATLRDAIDAARSLPSENTDA